jgi:hypothetical protein
MKTYKQLQERINMAKAKMGDVIKDFQDSDAPQFKGKSDEKRREMAIAAKMSAEEVEELDEISSDMAHRYLKGKHERDYDTSADGKSSKLKKPQSFRKMNNDVKSSMRALRTIEKAKKANEEIEQTDEELKGNQHKIDANKNGKVDGHDFKLLRSKKKVEEEVEELDELSKATLASYVGKAAKDFSKRKPKMGYDGQLKKMQNRSVGVGRALDKVYKEEVEEQIEESDGLKPFIVVHAKHGKFETHAGSTYEAAKNAAAHWKTKKGTSGMDVHRADITHSTQHVG